MIQPSPAKPNERLTGGQSNNNLFENRHKTQSQLANFPSTEFPGGPNNYKNGQK